MKKLKGAVIGCGGLGRVHIGNLLRMEDVELVAVCDIVPEQFTRVINTNQGKGATFDLSGVNKYTDAEEMLAKEQLDFAVVALPTYLHEPYSVMALNKGLHVLCEKPMARSVEGCRNMVEAAKRNGKTLMIGQTLRFSFAYEKIKEVYDSGEYGKLLRLEMSRNSPPPIWAWENWFMNFERSGGAAMDLHVHDVDFINYLLGKPDEIRAEAYHVRSGYDCLSAMYYYKDGPIVHVTGDWNMPQSYGFQPEYLAVFERAVITKDDEGFKLCNESGVLRQKDFVDSDEKYFKEDAYFVSCVRDGKPCDVVPMESTLQTMELVDAEMKSAQLHAPVKP